MGRLELGMHPPRRAFHPRHVHLLVGTLRVRVIAVPRVDGAIDRLADVPRHLLVSCGWQALDALLLETGAQLRLATALRTLPRVARSELAMKGAILRPGRSRDEMGAAYVSAHHGRILRGL